MPTHLGQIDRVRIETGKIFCDLADSGSFTEAAIISGVSSILNQLAT
jgi:hypothetical protein